MASKKSIQYVPLEERPEFIAALAALPSDQAELELRASRVRTLFHDAMLAGDEQTLSDASVVYRACVIKLNGGTHFGCSDIQKALENKFAAPAGQVPAWKQAGEFLLEVEGMRMVVRMSPDSMSTHCGAELHAIDFDQPFISSTGFRHQYMHESKHLGRTVDQAVRAEVMESLAGEGKAVAIDREYGAKSDRKAWPWLAEALAGVRSDGQLAMFGDVEKGAADKVPMSNADRQRLFRLRRKEQKAAQVAERVQSISLTHTERCVLSLGLLAHEDLDHRPKDWETSKKPGFDALLAKLWPEGDNGRYLSEPQRSTYRPSAYLRDRLADEQRLVKRLEQYARDLRIEVETLKRDNDLLESERNKAHSAISTWEQRLRAAGVSTDYRKLPGEE
ncbi:hypothetical protein [Pseudomonas sp. B16120]|uniref:hypothetical protein n=1 Tax=Pseudomonas sp. B16120 TaxID=3235108 RepID=UPI00378376A9